MSDDTLTLDKLAEARAKLKTVEPGEVTHLPRGMEDLKVGSIYGQRFIVVPSFIRRPRNFWARWFTLPWRPWQMTTLVPNPVCPPDGEYWVVGDTIYGSEAEVARLRSALAERAREHNKPSTTLYLT